MVPGQSSARPWWGRYWHYNIFVFNLFLASVVAVVIDEAHCLPAVLSQTHGKLVGPQGEDPCYLAASVIVQCDHETWTLLPFSELPGSSYPFPGVPGGVPPTECSCSRLAYNLFSACAACQTISGTPWVGYSSWTQNCAAEMINSPSFNYSGHSAALPWMFISGHDSFSVKEAMAAVRPLTSTPTNKMSEETHTGPSSPTQGEPDDVGGLIQTTPPTPQTPPPQTQAEIAPSTGPAATASVAANQDNGNTNNNNQNLLPAILAPILAVFGLAVLFGLWTYFYKRRRAKRIAPSAEFTRFQRRSIPLADVESVGVGGVRGMRSIDGQLASYADQNSGGEETDGDAPPAFTPGLFKDPIFEKGVAMGLANQSGTWSSRRGHGSSGTTGLDVRTERQDSLPLPGGDSPASLSLLAQGQGQMERQRLIPPGETY